MTVIDIDSMNLSKLPTLYKILEMMIRRIPSRLVVRHNLYAVLLRQFLHPKCLLVGRGERLLHHNMNAAFGTSFHRGHVVQDASVIDHHFGLFLVEHLVNRGIDLLLWKTAYEIVMCAKIIILFSHTNNNEIASIHGIDEVPKMSVCHSRHTDSEGTVCHCE